MLTIFPASVNIARRRAYKSDMARFPVFLVAISALTSCLTFAQPTPKALEFEVVSIKPTGPDTHGSFLNIGKGDVFTTGNMGLRSVITFAYDLRNNQLIGGPGWLESDHYDITAKPPHFFADSEPDDFGKMSEGQRKTHIDRLREMVRTMLAERIGLVVHHETKEETVYFLTVAKGGSKMKPVEAVQGQQQGMRGTGRGNMQGMAATMDMVANMLTGNTGHTVIDKTGLTGKYDWSLQWQPDSGNAGPDDPSQPAGPTIFTAVQEQLGLRLESAKGPVELTVIDQVKRPSEN